MEPKTFGSACVVIILKMQSRTANGYKKQNQVPQLLFHHKRESANDGNNHHSNHWAKSKYRRRKSIDHKLHIHRYGHDQWLKSKIFWLSRYFYMKEFEKAFLPYPSQFLCIVNENNDTFAISLEALGLYVLKEKKER